MKDFIAFIKEQGVVGLAFGFILGGAVSNLVSSLVNNIINPLLGVVLGIGGTFTKISINIGPSKIMVGNFLSTLVDFLVISTVVFLSFRLLKLNRSNIQK